MTLIWSAVVEAAHDHGRFMELDARPERLDLSDVHCELAKEKGVPLAISSGASTGTQLDLLRFGVYQARRGWLEPADVLNARPHRELRELIARR